MKKVWIQEEHSKSKETLVQDSRDGFSYKPHLQSEPRLFEPHPTICRTLMCSTGHADLARLESAVVTHVQNQPRCGVSWGHCRAVTKVW